MKLNDLRKSYEANPDQLYATCDWQMVKVVGPVSDKWRVTRDARGKATFSLPEETDPWAKCGDTSRRRPHEVGVRVEVFHYDKDGAQGESAGQMLVKQQDIGGPWLEFLALHADEVRARGEKFEAEQQVRKDSKALGDRVKELGFKWPVGTVKVKYPGTRHNSERQFEEDHYLSSKLGSEYSQVYTHGVTEKERSKIQVQPENVGPLPYWHPRLSVTANNDADVEYLLQVLTEGVKAIEKKAARRSARAAKQ